MPDYPLPATATQADLIVAVNDLQARLVPVEEDDKKAHGFINWCWEKRAYLIPIATALGGMLMTWIGARNNALPAVTSEPTPMVKPAEPAPASKAPGVSRLEDKQ